MNMHDTQLVLQAEQSGVLVLTINRPAKKNALTPEMYQALADALVRADQDASIRVVLFRGQGDAFTAGNDLGDFLNNPPTGADSPVFQFLLALSKARKPLVAAVHGLAVGIGTTMLLHCDLVYAAAATRLSMPFTQLGLVPEAGSSLLLPQQIGYRKAAELLLLGASFSAEEGHAMGLINEVVAEDDLQAHAFQQAVRLARLPAEAIVLSKRLLKQTDADALQRRMAEEADLFRKRLHSPEARAAMQAIIKR